MTPKLVLKKGMSEYNVRESEIKYMLKPGGGGTVGMAGSTMGGRPARWGAAAARRARERVAMEEVNNIAKSVEREELSWVELRSVGKLEL